MAKKKSATSKAANVATKPGKGSPAGKTKTSRSKKMNQIERIDAESAAEVISKVRRSSKHITTSSTAEYFSKNLQQVGFSSPTKAVLTTLKEALDNSLDACEDAGILPEIWVEIEKIGAGSLKNTDQIRVCIKDNGPGIEAVDIPKVFGEYLASSKFGRGRCSRGQQGIGISAATTWAMQTSARGAQILTKRKGQRKAVKCLVDMDLKNNRGLMRDKKTIEWDHPHGTSVEFVMDGRIQLNGEGGLLSYLRGTILLNPHMTLHYNISDSPETTVERVTDMIPKIPDAIEPHPHTMKLGEFISHARLYGKMKVGVWLKKGFSRVSDRTLADLRATKKVSASLLNQTLESVSDSDFKALFVALQDVSLQPPPTNTVLAVGEDGLALSIRRLGDIDFFSVLTRKPMIADFKPVQIEVAIARFRQKESGVFDDSVQVLRFANRVPLQFDKAACAIVKAINSVNWRSYGLRQPRNSLPLGPYIFAVSVVSPFIKFKNASKETIDASDELVEELRRALMQAGQRLSRYLKREHKAGELEQRVQHIEQFGPILVETLARILEAPEARKQRATEGLQKILEKDTKGIKQDLKAADQKLADYLEAKRQRLAGFFAEIESDHSPSTGEESSSGGDAGVGTDVNVGANVDANVDADDQDSGRSTGVVKAADLEVATTKKDAKVSQVSQVSTRKVSRKKKTAKAAVTKAGGEKGAKKLTKKKATKKKASSKTTAKKKKASGKKTASTPPSKSKTNSKGKSKGKSTSKLKSKRKNLGTKAAKPASKNSPAKSKKKKRG